MNVVRHEYIGVNVDLVLSRGFHETSMEIHAVPLGPEDVPAIVSTNHQVNRMIGQIQAREAGHATSNALLRAAVDRNSRINLIGV
jgi:hypothetical protein